MDKPEYKYTLANEQELALMKERVMKVRMICLDKMGKAPLQNPKYFRKSELATLLKMIKEIVDTQTDEQIQILFNEVVLDKVLNESSDYTTYPVYDMNNTPCPDIGVEGFELIDGVSHPIKKEIIEQVICE
jgi:hypothetical protein